MSNPFAANDIAHLSASSINKWMGSPAAWALTYLHKIKEGSNAAMARGIAIEDGIVHGLIDHSQSVEACARLAEAKYRRLVAMSPQDDDRKRAEEKRIAPSVAAGIEELRKYGAPSFPDEGQKRISVDLAGIEVPVIGFLDLYYPDHGLIVDIKTSARMPSAISEAHSRQGAIYAAAHSNHEVRFAYVTPRECRVLRQDDAPQRIDEVATIARRLRHFLAQGETRDELCALLTPDYSSIYFSSPAMRQAGREVFGF